MLKYASYTIVFQEVPNEVSLAFELSGCPFACKGCHSPHLQQDIGTPLLQSLPDIVEKYALYITCVCFMGGTQNIHELHEALSIVKSHGLKTCVYAGNDDISEVEDLFPVLDYIKIGSYKEYCGPLNNPNTNQRMFMLTPRYKDITFLFQDKNEGV